MALAASSPADRIEQLTVLTERLTGLLAAEVRAFEQRRAHEIAASQEETGRLANAYRHESTRVRADPALLALAPIGLRKRLLQATEAFDAVLARHERAVTAAKTVSEGIVRAIAEEVAAARAPAAGYGPAARAAPASATAIALNRRA